MVDAVEAVGAQRGGGGGEGTGLCREVVIYTWQRCFIHGTIHATGEPGLCREVIL